MSHRARPEVRRRDTPVHVTLRVRSHVWNLRSRRAMKVIERALAGVLGRREFRVVHFSVQGNHLHLIVEADDNRALSEGVQGLTVRLAKGLNGLMGAAGKIFADRFHARVLGSPLEVRRALAYVLLNHRSHAARRGERAGAGGVDPFSSGAWFDGWKGSGAAVEERTERLVVDARGWLLATGWRRRGLLSLDEVPVGAS